MKTILKYIIASAVATASLSGCIKETFPTNGATADQVAESTTALDAMVNAIPGALTLYAQNYSQAWDFGYPAINVSLTCMTGDMVVLGNTGYDWFANWMCNLYLSEDYVTGYQFWYNYYSWIKSCNDVISTLSAVPEESLNSDQRSYLGIALAFRAQFYLDLVRLFEPKECNGSQVHDYTIPDNIKDLACVIVTENTSEEQAKSNPRATVTEVYDQVIFPDLERAERMLADYAGISSEATYYVPDGCAYEVWALRGQGQRAYTYFAENAPAAQNDRAEVRHLEPYCYGQFTEGPASKHFGRSQVHWLTGTASTVMVGCVEGILGLRPDLDGLRLAPAIPREWTGFTMDKDFRGCRLHIRVENPHHRESGFTSLTVNGRELPDAYIPAALLTRETEVCLIL